MIRMFNDRSGFALPTILIASVIMLTVLITAVSATSSIRVALDNQFYTQLAREAAESGIARAGGCLQSNAYIAQWTGSSLYPNTACTGGTACTNTSACFVLQTSSMRSTFTVSPPETSDTSQLVRSTGKVELLRKSNGLPWRTFTYATSARVGIDLSLDTVSFGYAGGSGAFFTTIAADGKVRGVGYNGMGQLGNGTSSNTLTPKEFVLPEEDRAVGLFSNFVSGGYSSFALTASGKMYGSGTNNYGQLGDGTFTGRTTPVLFGLPADKKAKHASMNGFATFVLTTDNNLYASGLCSYGLLGSNYTVSGCANRSSYVRVALPTPTSDANTIPTTNIVTDYQSVYVRMQGGRVYGWGYNGNGQLARGNTVESSTPVQIGTYGNSGQPKAVSIAFDGITIYVVDDQGNVRASGSNSHGQLGGEKITIGHVGTGKCLDNKASDGVTVWLYACAATGTNISQEWTFRDDDSIYFPAVNKCIDNNGGDGVSVQLYTCNNTAPQKFTLRDDGTIYYPSKNKCLDNLNADGVTIKFSNCNTTNSQKFSFPIATQLRDFALPASAGKPIKVATDAWFASILTDTGEVWSAGTNNRGQLGNGKVSLYQPYPVKFILPVGVTAKDVYSAAFDTVSDSRFNNTFVVGSDGKVYGAGANTFGQLGNGTTTDASTPVAMSVINGTTVSAKQVVTGYGTTVVLTTNKKIYTVGNNANGQLGDGTTTNSSTPKANRYTNILPVILF